MVDSDLGDLGPAAEILEPRVSTAEVVSRELAAALRPYLNWTPANGDLFYIPRPEISESTFMVSDMVVELIIRDGQSRFHFNGTVEWALDSVESSVVVWLPREDQLRSLLGEHFLSLDAAGGRYVVTVSGPGRAFHTEPQPTAANAYARALLYVLEDPGTPT
jgi:hypothetical protein